MEELNRCLLLLKIFYVYRTKKNGKGELLYLDRIHFIGHNHKSQNEGDLVYHVSACLPHQSSGKPWNDQFN
jgi:hypothetical protein